MSAPLVNIPLYATQVPPQSVDMDKSLVSCVMQNEDVLSEVIDAVPSPEIIHHATSREIYRVILEMNSKGCARDLQLITQYLYQTGRLENVGGAAAVAEVYAFSPTWANARHYVGKSKQFLVRIGAHYHGSVKHVPKKAFDAVRYIEVDPKLLDEHETFFIILYRPEYNRVIPSAACWGKTVRKIAKKFGYYIADSSNPAESVTFKKHEPTAEDIRRAS